MMFFIAESMRRGVLLYNETYSTAAYESPGADAEFQSHGIMTESPVAVNSPANLECIVVFDHKSFPGRSSEFADQVRKHAGQLRLYREAIVATLPAPKPILLALHLPISGEILMVGA